MIPFILFRFSFQDQAYAPIECERMHFLFNIMGIYTTVTLPVRLYLKLKHGDKPEEQWNLING